MQRKKIQCPLCGQQISINNYSKHERRHQKHPETFTREGIYTLDHDDLFCKFCGKECKNKNSLVQHELRCKENPNRKEIVPKKFKGHTAWNKGLTKETDKRVEQYGKTNSINHKLGKHKKFTNPMNKAEVREKLSNTCLEKSRRGEWHTSLAKNMHINYNGIDLHGSWELNYAKYLDDNNINWVRCADRFPYIGSDGKEHYYTPDFYLVDSDEYVEIKGLKTDKDELKWSQFPSDKVLIVLRETDLKELGVL